MGKNLLLLLTLLAITGVIIANASSLALQVNSLANPSSVAVNQTLTLGWDKTFFGEANKTLQPYLCYNSSSNSLTDTGHCKAIRWPIVTNTGNAQISLTDSMIPTPTNCDRSKANFVFGLANASSTSNKILSNKISLTGIKTATVCPAQITASKSQLISNVTVSPRGDWPSGESRQISWSRDLVRSVDVWICTSDNTSCINEVKIGTNLTSETLNYTYTTTRSHLVRVHVVSSDPVYPNYDSFSEPFNVTANANLEYSPTGDWHKGDTKNVYWDKNIFGSDNDLVEIWLCRQSPVQSGLSVAETANAQCSIRLARSVPNYNPVDHNSSRAKKVITLPTTVAIGEYYLYIRKNGNSDNLYYGNDFSDKVIVTNALPALTFQTVSLDSNTWIGGTTKTFTLTGTNLNVQPELYISVCHPTNQTVCTNDFSSYTYNSCASDGTSCQVTTSAIGSNLALNHPEYFSNGQAKLRISAEGVTAPIYSPLFSYYPAGYITPTVPTVSPSISSVNVVDGSWTGGTTHIIGITGFNLASKPALTVKICNPTSLNCSGPISYSDYACTDTACSFTASAIGPSLNTNHPEFFGTDGQTIRLMVLIASSGQGAFRTFTYIPVASTPTTTTDNTPIWNGPKITRFDVNSLRGYGPVNASPNYYYLYGGDTVSLVVQFIGFATNLSFADIGIPQTTVLPTINYQNSNLVQVKNAALFLCNPDTANGEKCSRINTSIGRRISCGTGSGSCDNSSVTIGFRMPARVAAHDPAIGPYFRTGDGATRFKICPVAYPVNFLLSSGASEYVIKGYDNNACVYSQAFRLKDYNQGDSLSLPAGAGCYAGECVCVGGVRKTCASPWGSGANCPTSSPNYPNGICAGLGMTDKMLASVYGAGDNLLTFFHLK